MWVLLRVFNDLKSKTIALNDQRRTKFVTWLALHLSALLIFSLFIQTTWGAKLVAGGRGIATQAIAMTRDFVIELTKLPIRHINKTQMAETACSSLTVSSIDGGLVMPPTPIYQTFTASGGQGPYTFSATGFPAELNFSPAGLLSGVLVNPGKYTFTVTATDAHGCMGTSTNTIIVGPVKPVAGRIGALSMTENTDVALTHYVDFVRNPAVQTYAALTVEAWVKLRALDGRHEILNRAPLYFNIQNGKPALFLNGVTNTSNYLLADQTLPTNTWTHLAVTWDGSQVKFYINGELHGSYLTTGSLVSETWPLSLGYCNVCGTENTGYVGELDEVRLWSVARTADQIGTYQYRGLIGNESGLAAYWRFDEPSGITVKDASGHGLDGTLNNQVERVPEQYTVASNEGFIKDGTQTGGMQGRVFGYVASNASLTFSVAVKPTFSTLFYLSWNGEFGYGAENSYYGPDYFRYVATTVDALGTTSDQAAILLSVRHKPKSLDVTSIYFPSNVPAVTTVSQGATVFNIPLGYITGDPTLIFSATTNMPGLKISNIRDRGDVMTADVAASCSLAPGTYNVALRLSDGKSTIATEHKTITVVAPSISFRRQPANQTIPLGSNAIFSVSASQAMSYQWRRNGIPLSNAGNVSGAGATVLRLTGTTANDAGDYDVEVTGLCGSKLTSNPAKLNLVPSNIPTLGTYANTNVAVNENITVNPSTAPSNATSTTAVASSGFRGQLTVEPGTGIVRITNAQPPGNYVVTVNANSDGASVSTQFSLAVNNGPACAVGPASMPGTTDPAIRLHDPTIGIPGNVITGDFDNDGKLDLAVTQDYSNTLALWKGSGDGNFTKSAEMSIGKANKSLAVGDFNGDGYLDFVVGTSANDNVLILLGHGAGTVNLSIQQPLAVAVGDFNSDGNLDLIATGYFPDNDAGRFGGVALWLGNGAGGFTAQPVVKTFAQGTALTTGDFNGDGNLDFACADNVFSDHILLAVHLGDGAGGFSESLAITDGVVANNPKGSRPNTLATADFNGDGKLDLIDVGVEGDTSSTSVTSTITLPSTATIWLGNGDGHFTRTAKLEVGNDPSRVITGDFNGDGKLDFATLSAQSTAPLTALPNNVITFWYGSGDGRFVERRDVNVATNAQDFAVGDFNGDGKPDFAITGLYGSIPEVQIRFGNCAPTITASNTVSRQGDNQRQAIIANVSDAESAAGALQVNLPWVGGKPVYAYAPINNSGTVSATLTTVNCNAPTGTSFATLFVTDEAGLTSSATLNLGVIANEPPKFRFNDHTIPYKQEMTFLPDEYDDLNSYNSTITIDSISPAPTAGTIEWYNNIFGMLVTADVPQGVYTISVSAIRCGLKTTTTFKLTVGAASYATTSVQLGNSVTVTPTEPINAVNAEVSTTPAFKGLLTVNPTTGTVSIANAQPAGTYPITVKSNYASGLGSPTHTFNLTVTTPAACANAFLSGTGTVAVGTTPSAVAVGDFNLDGKLDFVTANSGSNNVTIAQGNGAGGFSASNVSVGTNPQAVALGDFNQDGALDFVTANYDSNSVSLSINGGASFTVSEIALGANKNPRAIAVGDFNGDGALDFATANATSNTVSLRFGDGAGGFPTAKEITVGTEPFALIVDDFNGDGKLDFATANATANKVSIRLGDGAGNFSSASDVSVGNRPMALVSGDFNADGKTDLAVANYMNGTVSILVGNGLGGFSVNTTLSLNQKVPPQKLVLTTADFNSDGKLDLAVSGSGGVLIWLGDGAGSFSQQADVSMSGEQSGLAMADFNRDGKVDLVATVSTDNSAAIKLGQGLSAPVLSYSLQTVLTGNSLTITPDTGVFPSGAVSSVAMQNISPALASGITVSKAGIVSVAPTVPTHIYTVTIRATGNCGLTTDATFQIIVASPPTLGDYPNGNVIVGGSTTIMPSAPPTNAVSVTASAPGFPGMLSVSPTTGLVKVSNVQRAGIYPITVRAFGGNTVTKTFTLTVQNPLSCGNNAVSFDAKSFPAFTSFFVTGDVDGDGKLDLITGVGSATLTISKGMGDGSFQTIPTTLTLPAVAYRIALGDFNGDGNLDLAAAHQAGSVSIRLGNGDGTFYGNTSISMGGSIQGFVVNDFDGDGKLDFATGFSNLIKIRLGDGTGNFSGNTSINTGISGVYFLKSGDFNNDGKPDIVALGLGVKIPVVFNDTSGSFTQPTVKLVTVNSTPSALALGDFDNDGKLDVAVITSGSGAAIKPTLSVRLGDGAGYFKDTITTNANTTIALDTPLSNSSSYMETGDFNGDGKLDLIYSNNAISLQLGDGTGVFTLAPIIPFASGNQSFVIGDFNNDGLLDIVRSVATWLNNCYTLPSLLAAGAISLAQGSPTTNLSLATISGGIAPYNLNATTNTPGLSVSNVAVNNGTVTADIATSCGATFGANTVTLTVTDGNGFTASTNITVNVLASINLLTSPADQTVTAGQGVTFTAAATNANASVQWQVSVNGGQFWTDVKGATLPTLSFATNASHSGNRYRAAFSNCGVTSVSSDALLTVNSGTNANTLGLVLSEFRLRGNSTQPELDEYVELFNNTTNDITVTTTDGSAGWAIAALTADGNSTTVLGILPNGTVLPAKAHRLLVNNSPNGYSLSAVATGDLTYTTDIADDTGLAIFNTANPAHFAPNTVIDAVGFQLTGTMAALLREGAGLTPLSNASGEYAWVRKLSNGVATDTNDNANDFVLVHPTGATLNGVTSQLGAPGPENAGSPIEMNRSLFEALFDASAGASAVPNQVRDTTPLTNATYGTLALRRSFTNNTTKELKQLRFRVFDITNAASGLEADVRLLSSTTATINGQTVTGLTLEQPPSQKAGGGVNASILVGTITPATPLPVGATVNVEFKLGVMRKGKYRFFLNIEVLQ